MATKKSASTNKKKKGSILPLIVVVIIGFLAYKANPEYWQQGRLFQDLKNGGQKKVETEEIANVPKGPVEPEVDPDAILEGSIKDAKTVPINIAKSIDKNDPMFNKFRSKFKTIYLVTQKSESSDKLSNDIRDAIEAQGLKGEFMFDSLKYEPKDKKKLCEVTEAQNFFCKQCDRKICLINPRKREFIVVAPTVSAALGRAKIIKESGW